MKKILDKIEFEEFIRTIGDGFILIKFYAEWCGPCKAMNPIFESLSKDLKLSYLKEFIEINRDENMDLISTMEFDFMSIPRFFLVKITDGKISYKKDLGGTQTKDNLFKQIEPSETKFLSK
jgi:thioredoxin 1